MLQERIDEALIQFRQVDRKQTDSKLQFDYMDAWLAMAQQEPVRAGQIASKYRDYPVDRWRELFSEILAHVSEIEGKVDDHKPTIRRPGQEQNLLAESASTFELKVKNHEVILDFRNLHQITVNYYHMDLEFLFSSHPFLNQDTRRFSIVTPNLSRRLDIPAKAATYSWKIPRELVGKNILIEVVGAGQRKSLPLFSNSLQVLLASNYGRLTVKNAETGKALSKVYIKVFARLSNGEIRFYKDGYTDLRGKFDYASLNTNALGDVRRFSILILSKDNGATVSETPPPSR
jgi:hypothetical protein